MIRRPPRSTPFPSTTLFRSHLMGLSPGWVTDLPLPRVDQLRILGNGVVPLQAASAVKMLLDDFHAAAHASEDRKSTRLELQSRQYLVCRLLLEKKNYQYTIL